MSHESRVTTFSFLVRAIIMINNCRYFEESKVRFPRRLFASVALCACALVEMWKLDGRCPRNGGTKLFNWQSPYDNSRQFTRYARRITFHHFSEIPSKDSYFDFCCFFRFLSTTWIPANSNDVQHIADTMDLINILAERNRFFTISPNHYGSDYGTSKQ